MWQFPRQRLHNAGKCSSERRAVCSNVRTAHVAAEALESALVSEVCRVAEHVGVEHKGGSLVSCR